MPGQIPKFTGKKVAVTCPYCAFEQLESPYAKSTFCRKCGKHYEPGKTLRPGNEPPPSLLSRFGMMLAGQKTRTITCFECSATQEVSGSSTSSLCPRCGVYIDLSDFKIDGPFSRVIQTQGVIDIGPKADVTSSKMACRELNLRGKLRGNLLCTGAAHIQLSGKVSGSLQAGKLLIEKSTEVEFLRPVRAASVEIYGALAAPLIVDGTVKIFKRGRLDGPVRAHAIEIERGGVFQGELEIAPPVYVAQEELDFASEESGGGAEPPSETEPVASPESGESPVNPPPGAPSETHSSPGTLNMGL